MSSNVRKKLKTIQVEYKGPNKNILNNMMIISRNIFNCCVFTYNIFLYYKNGIFEQIYNDLIDIKKKYKKTYNKKIEKYDIIEKFMMLFENCYNNYSINYNLIKKNNNIIFDYIKNKINDNNIVLNNSNIDEFIQDSINYFNKKNIEFNKNNKNIVVDNIVMKIVKYFYDKCYFRMRNELINKKPFTIINEELKQNIINNDYYFEDKNINYKDKIMTEFNIKIKSDQTLFKDVVYKFSLGENKSKLPADIILNIINKYYDSIKSFYAVIKINNRAQKPKFLDKNAKFNLFYFTSSFKQEKNKIRLTVGEYHSENYNTFQSNKLQKINNRKYYSKSKVVKSIKKDKKKFFVKVENGYINKKDIIDTYYLYFTLPTKFKNENIKMIEVKSYGNKVFLNIVYEKLIDIKIKNPKISIKNSISMDPGIKNLLTIYNPTGEQHIIRGTILKSINEFYNKKISELQSINKTKLNKHTFNRLYSLLKERNNKINAEINNIINLLIKTYGDKRYFIIGYNENWKQKVNLGTKTNRIFYGIPYNRIIFKLKSKLEDLGKSLIIKEESYTSKCDSLNLEDVKKQENYDGKRINRGLFVSKKGLAINADLNGAINIMRKVIDLKEVVGKKIFNPTKLVHN